MVRREIVAAGDGLGHQLTQRIDSAQEQRDT